MAQTTALEFSAISRIPTSGAAGAGEITRHGRCELVLMSADHYDWLVAAAGGPTDRGASWRTRTSRAEMDPDQAKLDLMK